MPLLRFSCLIAVTENSSAANKLGEDSFGPVYKLWEAVLLISLGEYKLAPQFNVVPYTSMDFTVVRGMDKVF